MKKIFALILMSIPTYAMAEPPNLDDLAAVQNRNDNARDAVIAKQQAEISAERYRENARQNEIARSVAARNRAAAQAITSRNQYVKENQDIDLEERKLKLQHDRVRSAHDEEFVKGELERQKAINNQIDSGKVELHVGAVDAD